MSSNRITASELARIMDDSATPIYVLDEDRRIVFCNAACARWLGREYEELIGLQCCYQAPTPDGSLEAVAAALCPPPKVFAGQAASAVVCRTTSAGAIAHRRGQFLPLGGGQDESAEVIAILEPNDLDRSAIDCTDVALHEHVCRFREQMAGRCRADSLIGSSPAIVRVRAQIAVAATSRAGVMIVGPRGAGKGHVARAIHYSQAESTKLVPLACHVLAPNLLRAPLRALWARQSEAKDSMATVYFEGIDALPSEVQSDLVEMVRGDSRGLRFISSSRRPLNELVGEGRISQELACALSTITIELPALSERIEDLPLLAQAFLEDNNVGLKQVGGFSQEVLDQFAAYDWPDNLDELAELVRQAHEAAQGPEITTRELPNELRWAADAASHPGRPDEAIVLEDFMARVEMELIARAMQRAKGNKSKAAKLLGLTRPRLYRRLVQLGLEEPSDKRGD